MDLSNSSDSNFAIASEDASLYLQRIKGNEAVTVIAKMPISSRVEDKGVPERIGIISLCR